jgi:periplasmic protein CpxP/Spy
MKLSSKRALIAAALATAFVGVSATAVAQGMGGMPHGMHQQHQGQPAAGAAQGDKAQSYAQHHAQRMQRMEKMRAEHQAQLKAALNLKPEQEPAWNAFLARTAPAARPAEMAKRIDATKSFYAALTPEQQQVFDAQSHGGMQRTGSKGGHGAHHGMHHGAGMSGGKMGGMMGGMGCEAMAKPQG